MKYLTCSTATALHMVASLVVALCVIYSGSPAHAQQRSYNTSSTADAGNSYETSEAIQPNADGQAEQAQNPTHTNTLDAEVRVVFAHEGEPTSSLEGIPVILHGTRPMGPFETVPPQPHFQSASLSNAEGIASFSDVPESVLAQGLRLQAFVNYQGVLFNSAQVVPSSNHPSTLEVKLYPTGVDVSAIEVSNLRMIVELWEEYLVFTQFWSLSVASEFALNTSLIPDRDFERGIPLRLPLKAQGIHASGPGETHIVNNRVFWKGTLIPNQPVTLQVRYSIPVKQTSYVYEQLMEYQTKNIEVIVPLQTQFQKIPRLDRLQLAAPGFEVGDQHDLPGLRPDMEFLVARGATVAKGESFRFRVQGLPFQRPVAPWLFLGLGFIGAGFIIILGHRERRRAASYAGIEQRLVVLERERTLLLDQLTQLERERIAAQDGDDMDYDHGILLLRQRIALIMKKIRDLKSSQDAA